MDTNRRALFDRRIWIYGLAAAVGHGGDLVLPPGGTGPAGRSPAAGVGEGAAWTSGSAAGGLWRGVDPVPLGTRAGGSGADPDAAPGKSLALCPVGRGLRPDRPAGEG